MRTFFVARRKVSGFLISVGVVGEMTDSGVGVVVLGIQWVKSSWSL